MTVDAGEMAVQRARVQTARRELGARLARYRQAARITQPELSAALGRTRSMLSRIEHGTRGMPAPLWQIADDRCGAAGELVTEHSGLVEIEQEYRDRCRTHLRQAQQAAAHAELTAAGARPAARPQWAWTDGAHAEELIAALDRLVVRCFQTGARDTNQSSPKKKRCFGRFFYRLYGIRSHGVISIGAPTPDKIQHADLAAPVPRYRSS